MDTWWLLEPTHSKVVYMQHFRERVELGDSAAQRLSSAPVNGLSLKIYNNRLEQFAMLVQRRDNSKLVATLKIC